MRLSSESFEPMGPTPAEFAFGQPGTAGEPCVFAPNRNPQLAWEQVPEGTASFVLLCIDPDVPSRPDDVNQPEREVPLAERFTAGEALRAMHGHVLDEAALYGTYTLNPRLRA